jgi:hypothetical protein
MTSAYVLDETPQSRRELRAGQYGGYDHAEDLIRAHFASIPLEVRTGIRLTENPDALAAASEGDAGSVIAVPDGCSVVDWTVRGSDPRHMVLSYIYETPDGRWLHGVQAYDEDTYQSPEETPAQKATRAVAMADHAVKQEAAVARAELDERLEQHRVELEQSLADRFGAFKDDLVSAVQEIVKSAQEDDGDTVGQRGGTAGANRGGSAGTTKKATSAGESGAGDPDSAPEPNAGSGGSDAGSGSGSGSDEETAFPKQHAPLNDLLKQSGADTPEGWDDMKVDDKIAYLESRGVKPEASGE